MPITATATIGPSGAMLTVQFWDSAGAPTKLTAVGGDPALTVNGSSPITPTPSLWGLTNKDTPFVQYAISPVAASATATLTFAAGVYTTAAGAVPAGTIAVANHTGGTLLPAFDPAAPRTMRVGTNMPTLTNYQVANFYANLARQSSNVNGPDATGNPTGPFPTTATIIADGTADITDALNFPNAPATGIWTLKWDGSHAANLILAPNGTATTVTLLSDVTGVGNIDHTRTYNITVNSSLRHAPRVSLTWNATGATNVRVFMPGEVTDGSTLFGKDVLRLAAGYACLRLMNPLWTGRSPVVDYTDFPTTTQLSFKNGLGPGFFTGGNVISLSPYTEPDGAFIFNPAWCSYTVTFDAPHNAKTGQVLVFSGSIATDAGGGVFNTTGGGQTQPLFNGAGVVRVIDATRVASHHFVATGAGGTILGTFAQTGLTFKATFRQGMPPEHCPLLSNAVGADCWYNVPHASSDACIAAQAQAVLANLAPGRKCYLEYTNEHWNTGLTFEQNDYCTTIGLSMPGAGATATATITGGQVTALTLTAPGSGYALAPAVRIAAPALGTTATAHATLLGGTLALVLDTPGSGYSATSPPAVTITAALNVTAGYVFKAANAHAIFAAAFAAAGRSGDLVRVMGSQYHNSGITASIVAAAAHSGISFDALAVAPYYDNTLGAGQETATSMKTVFETLSVDQLHDLSQVAMQFGPFFNHFADHRTLLDANGFTAVKFVCYEGGPQTGIPDGTTTGPTLSRCQRSLAWGRHPRMRELYLYWLTRLQAAGVVLNMDFLLFSTTDGVSNWAKHVGNAQRDGLGDGSDGLNDNRVESFDMSKVVSVMGGAINFYNNVAGPPVVPARHRPRALPTARWRSLPRS